MTAELRSYSARLLGEMDRQRIDLLLCAPAATPALPHGASKNFFLASSYAMAFNAAQMPAGVVPVTRVREGETSRVARTDAIERRAAEVDALSLGLPLGVQVVARPWRDHLVLAAMRAIEEDVSRDKDFPRTPVDLADDVD